MISALSACSKFGAPPLSFALMPSYRLRNAGSAPEPAIFNVSMPYSQRLNQPIMSSEPEEQRSPSFSKIFKLASIRAALRPRPARHHCRQTVTRAAGRSDIPFITENAHTSACSAELLGYVAGSLQASSIFAARACVERETATSASTKHQSHQLRRYYLLVRLERQIAERYLITICATRIVSDAINPRSQNTTF